VSDQPQRTDFIVLGDVMVDTFARIRTSITLGSDHSAAISRFIGGQAANTAAWLGWLRSPVTLIAACGADSAGTWARERLAGAGVTPLLHQVAQPTGTCVVIVDHAGERTMFSDPGANHQVSNFAAHKLRRALSAADSPTHVHLSGYLLERDPTLPRALLESARIELPAVTTSVDTAALLPIPAHKAGLLRALPYLDVLIGTQHELADMAEMADLAQSTAPLPDSVVLDHWRTALGFTGVIVMKQGGHGATVDTAVERHHVAAPQVHVLDTTGAGDAFSAGFLAAWTTDQRNLVGALDSGTQAAATAIAHLGAGPPAVGSATVGSATTEGR